MKKLEILYKIQKLIDHELYYKYCFHLRKFNRVDLLALYQCLLQLGKIKNNNLDTTWALIRDHCREGVVDEVTEKNKRRKKPKRGIL